ncbi:hypothetical protein B5T_02157 [Alloalcanivorax dieselolei B5]|uniref:Lipoprotein n=1 Tax=Alcanivorax dieselolei (strain DSM 16502 / CGMCC 1.3690 / MCCC 1A00001 / B-5) TaxID=930169 RepID=K0CFN9_ALCDB|nr:hypothetical protein [Alloalcanivorax dieselolei]AFT70431.1 hypothetical protein B5T_02157 [Alloalcanivorax dieselolei B5]
MKRSAFFIGAPLLLAGCLSDYPQFQNVDQSQLCVASTDQQAMECPEGELFLARLTQPNQNLRAYSALNTAALYCDTNYPIFENAAGIMCVMTHQRLEMLTGGEASQGMETQQQGQQQTPQQQPAPQSPQQAAPQQAPQGSSGANQ